MQAPGPGPPWGRPPGTAPALLAQRSSWARGQGTWPVTAPTTGCTTASTGGGARTRTRGSRGSAAAEARNTHAPCLPVGRGSGIPGTTQEPSPEANPRSCPPAFPPHPKQAPGPGRRPQSPVLHGVLAAVGRVPDGDLHAVVPQLPLLQGVPLGVPVIRLRGEQEVTPLSGTGGFVDRRTLPTSPPNLSYTLEFIKGLLKIPTLKNTKSSHSNPASVEMRRGHPAPVTMPRERRSSLTTAGPKAHFAQSALCDSVRRCRSRAAPQRPREALLPTAPPRDREVVLGTTRHAQNGNFQPNSCCANPSTPKRRQGDARDETGRIGPSAPRTSGSKARPRTGGTGTQRYCATDCLRRGLRI